jgi:hypothetical protein
VLLLWVIGGVLDAVADSAVDVSAGTTYPLSGPQYRTAGYKVAAHQILRARGEDVMIGVDWSMWEMDGADLQRVALLAGLAGHYDADLVLRWRAALGGEIVWGRSPVAHKLAVIPRYSHYDGWNTGFSQELAISAAVPIGPLEIGVTGALALSAHVGNTDRLDPAGFLRFSAVTADALFTIRIRE